MQEAKFFSQEESTRREVTVVVTQGKTEQDKLSGGSHIEKGSNNEILVEARQRACGPSCLFLNLRPERLDERNTRRSIYNGFGNKPIKPLNKNQKGICKMF